MLMGNYAWHGLMTAQPIALAVLLWPVYIVALWLGARCSAARPIRTIAASPM